MLRAPLRRESAAPANGKRMRLCVYCGRRTWHRLACEHHRDLLKNDPHYAK